MRYYGRLGLDKLFDRLVRDPPKNDKFRNLALVGHPGAGKRHLVWAVADYLASVLWVSHRVSGQDWKVRLFEPGRNGAVGSLFEVSNCPKLLSEILNLEIFEHVDVLMLDAPTKAWNAVSNDDGIAAFNWAGNDTRKENRRVIHVSSLGAFTGKQTERDSIGLEEIAVRPWTRDDFVKAATDEKLKLQICKTLGIEDPNTIEPDELVTGSSITLESTRVGFLIPTLRQSRGNARASFRGSLVIRHSSGISSFKP